MEPEYQNKDVTLQEALALALPEADHDKLLRFQAKIPEGMRGLFQAVLNLDGDRLVSLRGIRIQPDRALRVLDDFKGKLGKHDDIRKQYGFHEHGERRSYVLEGEKFDLALEKGSSVSIPASLNDARGPFKDKLEEEYEGSPYRYVDTVTLPLALEQPTLSRTEKRDLEKIIGNIPADLHDLFYASMVEVGGKTKVVSLALDPHITLRLLNLSILSPVAEAQYKHEYGNRPLLEGAELAAVEHPRFGGMSIWSKDLTHELAKALPRPDRVKQS